MEGEKTAEHRPEYPLDGSIFEDIVREAGEEQSQNNKSSKGG